MYQSGFNKKSCRLSLNLSRKIHCKKDNFTHKLMLQSILQDLATNISIEFLHKEYFLIILATT